MSTGILTTVAPLASTCASGFWDHVPPPQVDAQGYGARVPMMVISPRAKRGYISHLQMDHTSVLNFIQWNWGLPAVNGRSTLDGSVNLKDMFQVLARVSLPLAAGRSEDRAPSFSRFD